MNLKLIFIYLGLLSTELLIAQNQITELSLKQVIEMARMESPDAQTARHSFRSAYWNYKYYRANYLPSLSLTSDPNLNRAINKITMGDGSVKFVEQNLLNTDLTLNLSQNLFWTGGSFFLETSAQRMDLFSEHKYSWQTSPIMIGYRQSLFGYNSLKWDRRIEPVRYQEAKKSYVETLELVSANAIHKFFALATAQSDYDIASFNYANADTLYRYAQGRYNIGTITENEMLQLELNRLTEETNRMNARIEMDNCMQELRSYLGIHEDRDLRVLVSPQVPDFSVTQTADKLPEAYRNLLDQQYVSIGISLPILDWGRGKGQVRVARSNRDLVYTQVEQSRTDFELNVRKLVKQFNLQTQRVRIAARTDETAQRRSEVARKLYLLGKSTILDLNASISEKDSARRNYISALYNYWSLYYTLRSMTLYDFERNTMLTEDYHLLIE